MTKKPFIEEKVKLMRILVVSDSHRNTSVLRKIINSQPEAENVIFLGDNTGDIDEVKTDFPDRKFHIVCGNCDFFSEYPAADLAEIGGKKIFFCHGHTLSVKFSMSPLKSAAKSRECSIALYGHTHVSNILYEDGLYIVNPGSCSQPRDGKPSYAVIDITENGIMPIIIRL